MNKINERKSGVILSYCSIIISTIIQLIYTPFLIKKLGNSEYGIYSLVVSIIGYLAVLDFGFGDAIVMYTAKYHERKEYDKEKKLQGMFFLIFSIIGLVVAIIGIIICFNVDTIFINSMTTEEISKLRILMIILTFNLAITFPFSIYSSIIKAYEKFTFLKIVTILNSVIQPIVMIPLLLIGYKSIALTITITILNIIVLLSNYFYTRLKLNIKIKYYGFDKKVFKEIFNYSFYIFINIIVDKINWCTDQFVLGIFAGTTAVSIYAIASKINDMFIRLSTAISGVLFPKIAKMVAGNSNDEEISNEFIKTGRLQYLIIFLITSGFTLFGKEFFIAWVGKEFIDSYYVALLLIIPLSIPLVQNLGITILQAKNIHKFRSLLYLFVALGNIVISIILAKKWGAIGAAVGTAISLIVGNIFIINIYYYKKAKLDIPRFWKEILKMTVPFTIPISIILLLMHFVELHGYINLIIFGFIYTIIYIIISYFMVMNDYEKELVNKVFRKFNRLKRGEKNETNSR